MRHVSALALMLLACLTATGCVTKSVTMLPMRHQGMQPAIEQGSIVKGNLAAYDRAKPRRWDVVVYEPVPTALRRDVLRVVGLPGEKISIHEGHLLVNGQPLDPPASLAHIQYSPAQESGNETAWDIAEGHYFLLADISSATRDSRHFGAIPREQILGRVSRP